MINLKNVPKDHPLRNTPLNQIGAMLQFIGNPAGKLDPWPRPRDPGSWKIANCTFNELRNGWLDYYEWFA